MIYSLNFSNNFASVYGSGGYNTSTYNGASTDGTTSGSQATGTTTTPGADNGGLLANTGFDILLAVSLASLILFVAVLVRFARRTKKPTASLRSEAITVVEP